MLTSIYLIFYSNRNTTEVIKIFIKAKIVMSMPLSKYTEKIYRKILSLITFVKNMLKKNTTLINIQIRKTFHQTFIQFPFKFQHITEVIFAQDKILHKYFVAG